MAAAPDGLLDAGRDLFLGGRCVGCGRPGRVLCRACEAGLPVGGLTAWPTPTPAGLAVPYAAGAYDGVLKAMVNAHKEHAAYPLATPLGRVLGDVVGDLLARHVPDPGAAVVLVPVPSRRAVARRRGHDPLLRVSRAAAHPLRRRGVPARVRTWLTSDAAVRDQARLTATERARNLSGRLRVRRGVPVPRGLPDDPTVVVVDDVLTTGSTAREAQRALEAAGVRVAGIATVAATARRPRTGGSLPDAGGGD